jgi:hypothetical protein
LKIKYGWLPCGRSETVPERSKGLSLPRLPRQKSIYERRLSEKNGKVRSFQLIMLPSGQQGLAI